MNCPSAWELPGLGLTRAWSACVSEWARQWAGQVDLAVQSSSSEICSDFQPCLVGSEIVSREMSLGNSLKSPPYTLYMKGACLNLQLSLV